MKPNKSFKIIDKNKDLLGRTIITAEETSTLKVVQIVISIGEKNTKEEIRQMLEERYYDCCYSSETSVGIGDILDIPLPIVSEKYSDDEVDTFIDFHKFNTNNLPVGFKLYIKEADTIVAWGGQRWFIR